MRAKTVNEQNFERGRDPKKAMDVGIYKTAPELFSIKFDKWVGNNLDGEFKKYRLLNAAAHKYLQQLEDGNFDGINDIVYQHPTRVWYVIGDEDKHSGKDYKQIAGKAIRYQDEVYLIPKELGDIPWKRREIY